MPSFHGIHQDCDEIVKQLIVQLREQLRNPKVYNYVDVDDDGDDDGDGTDGDDGDDDDDDGGGGDDDDDNDDDDDDDDVDDNDDDYLLISIAPIYLELTLNCFVYFILQSTPKQLAECVDLLLQLKEPADELCDEFLAQ